MTASQKFWFRFEKIPRPTALNLGCGITALDMNDAVDLLNEQVLPKNPELIIKDIREGRDFEDLEKSHVRPNIGDIKVKGVWFPQGYSK